MDNPSIHQQQQHSNNDTQQAYPVQSHLQQPLHNIQEEEEHHNQQPDDQDNENYDDEEAEPFLVVRALYPFKSEDSTSLSFSKDELIQVLTQLESGWWYGYCRGERGWFPSNYVEIITQDDFDSASASEDVSDEDEMTGDDLWVPQTTVDGQVFYYNSRTGESSWNIPASSLKQSGQGVDEEVSADESRRDSNYDSRNNNHGNDTTSTSFQSEGTPSNPTDEIKSGILTSLQEQEQAQESNHFHSKNSIEQPDRADTESQSGSTRRSSWQTSAIPTRAGSPILQDSDQTINGIRKLTSSNWPEVASASSQNLPPLPTLSNPFDPEPSWESLADHTTAALQNLLHSAEKSYKSYYQVQATQIVEAIRLMLYASGTVDKDSAPIRMHRGLKIHHRQIMAALSKLVLSAKMASSFWPAEGSVSKMLADANDVASAVHQFIFTAQSAGVTVHDVDAKLILDPESPVDSKPAQRLSRAFSTTSRISRISSEVSGQTTNRNSIVSITLFNQLDFSAKSSCKALGVLSHQLKKAIETSLNPVQPTASSRLSLGSSILNSAQSSQLVNQCHQTISQLGSLLNLVGEFYTQTLNDFPEIEDNYFIDVRSSKQGLYNNVASLVMAIQLATDPMVQTSVLEMALDATTTAEKSTMKLVSFMHTLAEERNRIEGKFPNHGKGDSNTTLVAQPHFGGQRQTDIGVYFQSLDSEADEETVKNTRNRSNSQISSMSSTDSASNASAPTTPGTEYTGRSHANGYPFPLTSDTQSIPPTIPTTPTGNSAPSKHDARGDKLRKMLGADAPTPKPKPVEQPWYLGHEYEPADISFNMEGHVKGGTLPALVERLTLHDGLDLNFVATFLLTYRSFATTEQLFTLLFRRFVVSPPAGIEPHEYEQWQEKKLTPIRLRVFNIIKSWLENYYLEDEAEDRQILAKIKEFSESSVMRDAMSFAAVQLIKLVERRETSDGSFRKMILNMSTQAPSPITPRNLKKIRFMDIDPLELARQLTIMEAQNYNKIKPIECLAKAWTSEDPEVIKKASNIKNIIETSNLYSNWINEIVLSEKETKKRAAIIKHLVALAEKLRVLNNFSMLAATTAALSQSPIHRLRRTWELVPAKTMNSLAALQAITSSAKNWADYRAELHSVNPPCVPFVGVYLTDLVMIEDGNPDFLRKADNHINFYKRVGTAEVIREIQQYQSVPYCLTVVPEIQTFIRRGMDGAKSVTDLYNTSLTLEPRIRPLTGIPPLQGSPFLNGSPMPPMPSLEQGA